MANVLVGGVKGYALTNPESGIAGSGFEISSENFGSLLSLGGAKNANAEPIFNFVGYHYLDSEHTGDKDLTVLGYSSFGNDAKEVEKPSIHLGANQGESYSQLESATSGLGQQGSGVTQTTIDGNNIVTLNDYLYLPVKEVVSFDPAYTAVYPPQLEK